MPKKGVFLTDEAVEKINEYIKLNKSSQDKFARELGVSERTFRTWLKSDHSVNLDALDIIIDLKGLSN